jgi:FtsP/CotA-like multicopper oxidase with cupredoxin domain
MKRSILLKITRHLALATVLVAAAAAHSPASDVYFVARGFDKTMPDAAVVPMWGFAVDVDGDLSTIGGEVPTVPGPTINMPYGDTTLNIHVRNELPEPVSLVIPGQPMTLSPVSIVDSQGRSRAVSFTNEVAPGTSGTYSWTGIRNGTAMYQSGSHVAVQVQMGLYGAVTADSAPGAAYPGVTFDSQLLLIYSEIDVDKHIAIATGTYGTPPGPTSMANYQADYFLVNGEPFEAGQTTASGVVGQTTLVRFVNAGLRTYVPTLINGGYMELVAQDGFAIPFSPERNSIKLPAAKTVDALFRPEGIGVFALADRRLHLSSGGGTTGGMLTLLDVPAVPCGDVNGSGDVGIVDALLVAQYVVGLRTCTGLGHIEVCDISPPGSLDGACNIGDALKMAQCSVGLVPCNFNECTALTCGP